MYIAVLDFKNLDNPLFLKSFAEALSKIEKSNAIILHGDSLYTDRLMQTGLMREQAIIRSMQDLNHRIVTFLADYGIACIGVNGFQKNILSAEGDKITTNINFFKSIPAKTIVVLSGLAIDPDKNEKRPLPLPRITNALARQLNQTDVYVFSTSGNSQFFTDTSSDEPKKVFFSEIVEKNPFPDIPEEFRTYPTSFYLCKPLYNNNLSNFVKILNVVADRSSE